MLKYVLLVALGGGVGSALRFLTSVWAARLPYLFPWGTFFVNLAGCLLIGFLAGMFVQTGVFSRELRVLLITGFCGGYTTFSSFSLENLRMLESGQYGVLALYVVSSVVLGLAAVWGGNLLAKCIQG